MSVVGELYDVPLADGRTDISDVADWRAYKGLVLEQGARETARLDAAFLCSLEAAREVKQVPAQGTGFGRFLHVAPGVLVRRPFLDRMRGDRHAGCESVERLFDVRESHGQVGDGVASGRVLLEETGRALELMRTGGEVGEVAG